MNSAEEVAKGIAYDIALAWCKDQHQQCSQADEIIPLIAQALTAYADERVKEDRVGNYLYRKSYKKGHSDGMEVAAKIADESEACCGEGERIGALIRTRK